MNSNNELNHHGIQGQKWGRRRYQNPDGTLTAEGRIRYNHDGTKRKLDYRHKENHKMHKKYNRDRAKKAIYRDTAIGMIAGTAAGAVYAGPMGALVGMFGAGLGTEAVSAVANFGRNIVSNSKYKKVQLADQAGLVKEGKKWVESASSDYKVKK
jgi:hypothetical protein